MCKVLFFLVLIVFLFAFGCSKDMSPIESGQPEPLRPLTADEQFISKASDAFGLDLFRAIVASEAQEDVFISPLSVSMALGMTLNGANSTTFEAMQKTLRFDGLSDEQINAAYKSLTELLTGADPKVIFEIANSIWYRDEFTVNPRFIETNRTFFDAAIFPKDFNDPSTVKDINDWVSEKTHGKITKVLDKIDPLTLMFLINAIYFNGTWQYEFEKEQTFEATFYLNDGQTAPCHLMKIKGDFNYLNDGIVQIIDLPYGNGNFSMTIFLPQPGKNIDEFINQLDPLKWQAYIGQLDTLGVSLELPKLKLEYNISLNKVLSILGMGIAFDSENADFGRMLASRKLFISKVLHKTFVQVDEKGTEAAAVTVVEMGTTSIDPPAGITMRVDRPYLFAIRERQSGTLLFLAKILYPEWSE